MQQKVCKSGCVENIPKNLHEKTTCRLGVHKKSPYYGAKYLSLLFKFRGGYRQPATKVV